ncbi:fatty acid hydroxylase isoform B [Micractinium conductrix]|uniref:Fatty acid hydroxylase isoform B n=1 Tax=Micractinium conductrix TaxID=554055 RepID=A0A2P6VIC2_9CHLO|nr:fatty acid hydroxylase isoform B [Micractinium conductrix]|eukprot:PSC73834.1 fatty acid hydroxylase isoform B [Micractinium conductrix]
MEMEPVRGAPEQPPRGSAPPAMRGGALSLVQPGGREQEVPCTLRGALALFFSHPSSLLILAGLLAVAAVRVQSPVHPAADVGVAAGVAALWCLQEWVVHAWLLHSPFDWAGRRIHEGHHARPYFHVSIDGPPLVAAFMAASLALFWCAFRGSELALTAALVYYAMGLAYEFTHYIAHTRYLPRSRIGKAIRMHHMLHHTRNEANWLAFVLPAVDALFGTAPDPASVRMSDMAKAGLRAAREAANGGGGGGGALERLRASREGAAVGGKS